MRRHLLAEELLADRAKIGAVADVGQVGIDLDDVGHRAAAGLDLGLQGLQGGAGLGLEIAGVLRGAVRPIGDLAGDVEDRLDARYLDRLGIERRVPDAAGGIGFDRRRGKPSEPLPRGITSEATVAATTTASS